MDTSRRTFIHMLSSVAALAEANKAFPTLTGHLSKDHQSSFEQKIATQWDIYHFSPWKREKCIIDLNWTMTTV